MREQRRSTACAAATMLALSLATAGTACKDGNPLESGIVPAVPDFSPATLPQGVTSDHVSLRRNSVNGSRVLIDVVVTNVNEPVSGIALKLTYPSGFSRFVDCSDGGLFAPGDCFFAESAPGSGEVFIGRSLTAPEPPTPVSGGRVIVRVEFIVFGKGSGPIVFEGQNLGGGDASALLDANGDPIFVQWFAGNLVGR